MVTLDPRRLLVLAAVSDRGGVVAASEVLHVTPSAVSQQLVRLERDAGVTLVDRSSRQAQLTVAGEQLADRGRRISHELEAAEADVAGWFGASGTTVAIGAFSTAIKRLLIPMIPQLQIGHDVTVALREREARRAIADLHGGLIDLALVEATSSGVPLVGPAHAGTDQDGPSTARLRTVLRVADEFRIAVPADWPALDWLAEGVIVRELTRRPWVVASRGSAGREAWTGLTDAWRFTPRVAHECYESASLIALVSAGLGATVVPHLAWADVTDRTLLLDTDAVEASAGGSTGMGVRHIAALVRDTPRRVPAMELTIAALRRAAEAEDLAVEAA
jgi:DNA-binding transcriptional LysR family regulator